MPKGPRTDIPVIAAGAAAAAAAAAAAKGGKVSTGGGEIGMSIHHPDSQLSWRPKIFWLTQESE